MFLLSCQEHVDKCVQILEELGDGEPQPWHSAVKSGLKSQ